MLKREKYIWSQLTGPQITAFETAMFDYLVMKFDALLDYYETLNIETANSQHLDFFGKMMRIPRALIVTQVGFEQAFKFSLIQDGAQPPRDVPGFSGDETSPEFGLFGAAANSDTSEEFELISDGIYRRILITLGNTSGYTVGLNLIDDLAYEFLQDIDGNRVPYTISYTMYHDIEIRVEGSFGYSQVVLQQIFNQIFNEQPTVNILLANNSQGE
jgi:hypothetical protein